MWEDKLAPIPHGLIESNISDSSRSFLTKVGLPTGCPLLVTFYHDERLLQSISAGGTDYLVMGDDYGTMLGLKGGTDELWAVDPSGNLAATFVNSRICDFVLFLALYEARYESRLPQASTEETEAIIEHLRRHFDSCDRRALEDVDHWWSSVLGDIVRELT